MAGKWRTATVADLQRDGILLVEDGNHGEYRPRSEEFVESGVAFIRAADMEGGRVLFQSAAKINESARQRITKGIGAPGDVLLSHKGTVGKVALAPADAPEFVCSPQTTFWRTRDEQLLDRRYLYALLRSPAFQAQLASRAGETDMAPYVSLTSQRGLLVTLPPISEQRAIGHILGKLDDKIELNRRMNETLEAIARAIFKSWFVNFDPVRAKMDGRWRRGESLPGLPAHLYDLFPGKLVDSELGEIPNGWEVATLGDIVELAYGKALKEASRKHGNIPVFGSNGQVGWHDEKLVDGPGIVVGRKGNPGFVTWAPSDFFVIDTAFYIARKGCCSSLYFIYYALRQLDLASLGADSAVPGLNRNIAYMSAQLIPPQAILDAFDGIMHALFKQRFENDNQTRTLGALRDTILPKLISGELRPVQTTRRTSNG
jgi:type I restriction enzyme S subunit